MSASLTPNYEQDNRPHPGEAAASTKDWGAFAAHKAEVVAAILKNAGVPTSADRRPSRARGLLSCSGGSAAASGRFDRAVGPGGGSLHCQGKGEAPSAMLKGLRLF